jgi:hypothetical protein
LWSWSSSNGEMLPLCQLRLASDLRFRGWRCHTNSFGQALARLRPMSHGEGWQDVIAAVHVFGGGRNYEFWLFFGCETLRGWFFG